MELRNTAREPMFTARYSIDLVVHQDMGGRWMIRMPGNQLHGPFTSCLDAVAAAQTLTLGNSHWRVRAFDRAGRPIACHLKEHHDAESAVVRGPTAARLQPLHEQKLQAI